MDVVVVVDVVEDAGGVVVTVVALGVGGVVGVVVDGVPVVGTGKPVPTTVSVAVGVEAPPRADAFAATRAAAEGVDTVPLTTGDVPVDWLPVPDAPLPPDAAGPLFA
jgi:hypothetical protein